MRPLTLEEIPNLVDSELRRAVLPTWRVDRSAPTRWDVIPDGLTDGASSGLQRGYEVYAFGHDVVVTHGNTDAGALTMERLTRAATMIRVDVHPIFSMTLADCFRRVFEHHAPNTYGLT